MFLTSDNETELQQAMEKLPSIFGIHSFSPIAKCEADLEAIKEKAIQIIGDDETEEKHSRWKLNGQIKAFRL